MTAIWQDLRYAARMLRRQPGFTLVAVLTLALGIGANTAVFTVVNGVLLRPLPYGDSQRLVVLMYGRQRTPVDVVLAAELSSTSRAKAACSAERPPSSPTTVNITGQRRSAARRWRRGDVESFFSVLGVRPRLGRAFLADDAKGTAAVGGDHQRRLLAPAVRRARRMSSARRCTWTASRSRSSASRGPEVTLPRKADFWQPLIFTPRDVAPPARGAQWVGGGRAAEARTSISRTPTRRWRPSSARLAADFPRTNQGHMALAVPLQEHIVSTVRPALLILLGAVTLVLLIACVNVANLLLARAQRAHRAKWRCAPRLAPDAGGSCSSSSPRASSSAGLAPSAGSRSPTGARARSWRSDRRAFRGWPTSASTARARVHDRDRRAHQRRLRSGAGAGERPERPSRASSAAPAAARSAAAARGCARLLVVCEMALAVVLLVGAGLLIRSYQRSARSNPGFVRDHVLTFNVSLPEAEVSRQRRTTARSCATLIVASAARPGDRAAPPACSACRSTATFSASSSFTRQGETDSADSPSAGMRIVTPDYFSDDEDSAEARPAVRRARRRRRRRRWSRSTRRRRSRYWPGSNPIGQQLHLGVRLARGARSGRRPSSPSSAT